MLRGFELPALRARPERTLGATTLLELVVLAVSLGIAGVLVFGAVERWFLLDVDAYWNAALRLRSGEPLYPTYADVDAFDIYRYAPWFAYAWVPLTYLPRGLVDVAWSAVLVAASVLAVWHLLASRRSLGVAAGALIAAMLILAACWGNVQPILIAGLVHTIDRRAGPLWVGIAASLKFVPILYVLVYIGRGEWRRALIAVGVAVLLLAPMLLFDLSGYTTDPGEPLLSLYNVSPVLWAVVAGSAILAALVASRRRWRYAWIAVNAALVLAGPRAHLNYLSYFAVGTRSGETRSGETGAAGSGRPGRGAE